MIKLRLLRWEDYLGLSGWALCNHKGPQEREAGGSEEGGDLRVEAEVREMWGNEFDISVRPICMCLMKAYVNPKVMDFEKRSFA